VSGVGVGAGYWGLGTGEVPTGMAERRLATHRLPLSTIQCPLEVFMSTFAVLGSKQKVGGELEAEPWLATHPCPFPAAVYGGIDGFCQKFNESQ
jgi:hypothetical protein